MSDTKFKVGDEVRVVADEEKLKMLGVPMSEIGIVGIIVNITDGNEGFNVFNNDDTWWYDRCDLELVEEPVHTKKRYGHPRFYEMLEAMAELHSRKNHDYAGTSDPLKNLRACKRLELDPFMGVMVRLQDKWSRLEEFVKSGTLMVKNESVKDTLMDNAVYSILAIILYEEQEKEELDYQAAIDHETGDDQCEQS